ncbi:MAG: proton-conducting transporter membrane subunit [Candidatus Jordarchaeaceae archaeon]
MYSLLPLLSLIAPFFVGSLCLFVYPFKFLDTFFRKIEKIALISGTSLTLLIVTSMIPYIISGESLETPIFSLKADLTNIVGAVGVTLIFFLVSIYNFEAEKGGRLKPSMYNFFVLLFLVCMLGLLLSHDLFGIFLFVEMTIGVSIILVVHAPGKLSPEGSFKYLIITAISALFVLIGVLTIFVLTNNSNILAVMNNPEPFEENPRLVTFVVACFIVGLGADIGLVPFHGWVPDILPASPPTVNGFFTAEPIAFILALHKLIHPFYMIYPSPTILWMLLSISFISIMFGVFSAYSQKDFLRMFAYCTIEEFGHMILPFGIFTSLGFVAGQFYLVNASLMKTGLVLCLGSVLINAGTRDMNSLGGLMKKMKNTALSYIVCSLSIVGAPPFSGFYAKWLLYSALYDFLLSPFGEILSLLTIIFLLSMSLISLTVLVRSFHLIFLGRSPENLSDLKDVPWKMWLPTVILAFITTLIGIQPDILFSMIKTP